MLAPFAAAWIALLAGLAACIRVRRRERRLVGAVLWRGDAGRRARILASAVLAFAAAVALAAGDELPPSLSLPTLALVLWAVWARPAAGGGSFGEEGVRLGWLVRRFEEVDEWRLQGDHLRVSVDGRWRALAIPAAEHARIEAVLERRAPGKRSPYR